MAKLNKIRTIAAALLGTAVMGAPITSFAQDFRTNSRGFAECKVDDRNNQLVGGLIGAVAGGVFGSQVSGNGARTEGSILGAALGAAAGAGIADGARNCRTEAGLTRASFDNSRGLNNRRVSTTRFAENRSRFSNRGFRNDRSFRNNRSFNRRNVSYDRGLSHIERRLVRIDKEIYATDVKIDKLNYEIGVLKDKRHHGHDSYRIDRKIKTLKDEVIYLKECKYALDREARLLRKKLY